MEPNPSLERGNHTGKYRAHRAFPGHKAKSKETIEPTRSGQAIKRGGTFYHHDEEEGRKFLRGSHGAECCIFGRCRFASRSGKQGLCQHFRVLSGIWNRKYLK
eukprot:231966-Heterocapsa_arctica.AAC.1